MKMKKLIQNDFIRLLPFLVLYLLISTVFAPDNFVGDEIRYFTFAQNLTNGFYSPPYPEINLWNGPGYPMLLTPFVALKLPLIFIRVFNALLVYLALVFLFKALSTFPNKDLSAILIIASGLYFPVFQAIPFILTESFCWFLISLSCYFTMKLSTEKAGKWMLIFALSATLAFLALTKVIFVYALIVSIIMLIPFVFLSKSKTAVRRYLWIFSLALIFCMPYIGYTYKLTGRLLYLSNSGGISIYTLSSTAPDETGEWKSTLDLQKTPHHKKFVDSISVFQPLNLDDAFRQKAIQNLKEHPQKVFTNWLANLGRLFFSYPFSYSKQSIDTYFTIVPNMFLVVFMVLTLPVFLNNFKIIPFGLKMLFMFYFVYLFGSSAVSAYSRMFYITVPFWIVYFQYMFSTLISIKINYKR